MNVTSRAGGLAYPDKEAIAVGNLTSWLHISGPILREIA